MSGKVTIFWTDLRGHKVTRDVVFSIDVERFRGTPGYALLVVAANTNLSVGNIERYLTDVVGGLDARSASLPETASSRNSEQSSNFSTSAATLMTF